MDMNAVIKVLLVEDNPVNIRFIQKLLLEKSKLNFELTCIHTLSESIAEQEANPHHITLLDLGLPDSQEIKTFESFHSRFPDVPIVIMTGLDNEKVATDAIKNGAQDYIVKGMISAPIIERALTYAIQRKSIENQLKAILNEWETTFYAISDQVMILDNESRIVKANTAFETFFNFQDKTYLGKYCWDVLDVEKMPCEFCPSKNPKIDHYKREDIEIEYKPGRFLVKSIYPVLDEEQRLRNTVHIHRDITEFKRKDMEEKEREKMQSMLQLAGTACHELNQPLQSIHGYTDMLVEAAENTENAQLAGWAAQVREQVRRLAAITKKINSIISIQLKDNMNNQKIIDFEKSCVTKKSPESESHA